MVFYLKRIAAFAKEAGVHGLDGIKLIELRRGLYVLYYQGCEEEYEAVCLDANWHTGGTHFFANGGSARTPAGDSEIRQVRV